MCHLWLWLLWGFIYIKFQEQVSTWDRCSPKGEASSQVQEVNLLQIGGILYDYCDQGAVNGNTLYIVNDAVSNSNLPASSRRDGM
ncbi:unnamed protein product [Allacma fusca]|uniref:Uncharacterized protein n=1 Tax=Allacma fusca TaxID=39272 RepID=A0A8J2PHC2_9HEXA|nr:unnamed protein product [Allacma fusca]